MIFMHCELLSQSGESCKENNAIDGLSTAERQLTRETLQIWQAGPVMCGQIQDICERIVNESMAEGKMAWDTRYFPMSKKEIQSSPRISSACETLRLMHKLTNTIKYYYCMRLAASFAGVAKPGQRRWIQGPVTKVFVGSNPIPRTYAYRF